jgi:hypothetical protein
MLRVASCNVGLALRLAPFVQSYSDQRNAASAWHVVFLRPQSQRTSVKFKTLQPSWKPEEATFTFECYEPSAIMTVRSNRASIAVVACAAVRISSSSSS